MGVCARSDACECMYVRVFLCVCLCVCECARALITFQRSACASSPNEERRRHD